MRWVIQNICEFIALILVLGVLVSILCASSYCVGELLTKFLEVLLSD